MNACFEIIKCRVFDTDFVGKLSPNIFNNLTNIQFATFHRQRKLKTLDIAYSNLKKINFTSFQYAFDGLETLYVDENNINELDSSVRLR